MSTEIYSFPQGPNERFNFLRTAYVLFDSNATVWSISIERMTSFSVNSGKFFEKYDTASNQSSQSPGATAARNRAWDAVEVDLIDIYNHNLINNDLISTENKKALGIKLNEDAIFSLSVVPTTFPVVTLTTEGVGSLHVNYSDSETLGSHRKPDNVGFCELCCKIGDPAPASVDECTTRYNISRSHQSIDFQPEQSGKIIHAYPRWVNKNGKFGPWGNKISTRIP